MTGWGRLVQRETVRFVKTFIFRPWFETCDTQIVFKCELIRNKCLTLRLHKMLECFLQPCKSDLGKTVVERSTSGQKGT